MGDFTVDLDKTLSTIDEEESRTDEDEYMENKLDVIVDACEAIGYKTIHLYNKCLVHDLDIQTVIAMFYRVFYCYEHRANEVYDIDDNNCLFCRGGDNYDSSRPDPYAAAQFEWELKIQPRPIHNPYTGYSLIVETGCLVRVDTDEQVRTAKFVRYGNNIPWDLQDGPYSPS